MSKAIFTLLMFLTSIITLTHAQAMDKNDKYMNDSDWAQFHQNRVNDPTISDQSRWEASQLLSQTYGHGPNSDLAYTLYDQGANFARNPHRGEGIYDPNRTRYRPPLSSNSNVYFPHNNDANQTYISRPSTTYQSSGYSQSSNNDFLDDCRRNYQHTGRNFDRDLEDTCTLQ